jgi:leader peptidase (prepilin peptidase)/N-methyltransferase
MSWVVLGGRCRTCSARISLTYPLVEIATAIVFAWVAAIYGLTPLLLVRLVFASAMIVLFAVDLEHHLLPNAVTLPGIVVGFAASLLLPPGWISSLLGILLGGGVLLGIGELYYRARGLEGLGMGDVKMLAMIGAFLGWPLMLVTLVLASIAGSLLGVALLVSRRGGMHAELPFGTFLALAALIAAGAGDAVVEWYLSYY